MKKALVSLLIGLCVAAAGGVLASFVPMAVHAAAAQDYYAGVSGGSGQLVLKPDVFFTRTGAKTLVVDADGAGGTLTLIDIKASSTRVSGNLYMPLGGGMCFDFSCTSQIYSPGANQLSFWNGTDRLTIAASGEVGIPAPNLSGTSFKFNGKTCVLSGSAISCT